MGQTLSEPVVDKVRIVSYSPPPHSRPAFTIVCLGNGRLQALFESL